MDVLRTQRAWAQETDVVALEKWWSIWPRRWSLLTRMPSLSERKLKPLLTAPGGYRHHGRFLDRLAELEVQPRAFPERFGYARSVQAALAGDSLRILSAWDAAVERAMQERRWASDFTPLLAVGKDLLLEGIFHRTQSVTWSFEGPMAISLPEEGAPRLFLGPTGTLRALAKGDTLEVKRTAGEYVFAKERFEGRSGRVDWGRSGWDPEKNFADFDAYAIRLKSPGLSVDSARFTTELFPDPLLGQLTDKARARKRDEETGAATDAARYPRFDTYVNRLSMPDIVPGVDFQGGLTVRGAELQGKGNEAVPATLDFRKGDTVLVQCRANLFILRADQFSGQGSGGGAPRWRHLYYRN